MHRSVVSFAFLLIPASLLSLLAGEKVHEPLSAQVTVRARGAGCSVGLDDQQLGKTDEHGALVLKEVDPGDHYLHLRCPNEQEKSFFISPRAGQDVALDENKAEGASKPQADAALDLADAHIRLPQLVQEAVQLRSRGKLAEAVQQLRAAIKIDADNSDLHRELGITFLMGKDWKRARVEMLEAIRHDPTDADAYNGLGYALEKMGALDEAVKRYGMATQLDPADPTYRTHYFDILSRLAKERTEKK
jgi:hypothetical protein